MKMNEVLPDLEKALGHPSYAPAGRKPTGTTGARKPLRPGQQPQQQDQQDHQQGQQKQTPQQQRADDLAKDKALRPGQKVALPTKDGAQEYKVTRDMGREVEIENPEGTNSPSQPNKLVYDKEDLKKAMRTR